MMRTNVLPRPNKELKENAKISQEIEPKISNQTEKGTDEQKQLKKLKEKLEWVRKKLLKHFSSLKGEQKIIIENLLERIKILEEKIDTLENSAKNIENKKDFEESLSIKDLKNKIEEILHQSQKILDILEVVNASNTFTFVIEAIRNEMEKEDGSKNDDKIKLAAELIIEKILEDKEEEAARYLYMIGFENAEEKIEKIKKDIIEEHGKTIKATENLSTEIQEKIEKLKV